MTGKQAFYNIGGIVPLKNLNIEHCTDLFWEGWITCRSQARCFNVGCGLGGG